MQQFKILNPRVPSSFSSGLIIQRVPLIRTQSQTSPKSTTCVCILFPSHCLWCHPWRSTLYPPQRFFVSFPCYHQIKSLHEKGKETLINAFVILKADYCHSFLVGPPGCAALRLQLI